MNAAAIIARARRVYPLPEGTADRPDTVVSMVGSRDEHGRRLCVTTTWRIASAVLDKAHDGYVTATGNVCAVGPRWAVFLRVSNLPARMRREQEQWARARTRIADPERLGVATDAELAAEAQQVARALVAADPVPHLTADDAARCVALTIEAFADAVACGVDPDLSCVESLFADPSIAALQLDAYHAAIDAIERLARIAVGEGGTS